MIQVAYATRTGHVEKIVSKLGLTNALKINKEENAMKYVVNEGCIGCGLCAGTCPSVFSMGDDGVAVAIDTDVPEDALDSAAEAKESCPVGAIEEA